MYSIQNIKSAPRDRDILLIVKSYDCGWVMDSGRWDSMKKTYVCPFVHSSKNETHLPYSHWMEVPKTGWKKITTPKKDSLLILADLNEDGEVKNFSTGWWYEKEQSWMSTGTISSERLNYNSFTHYIEIKEDNLESQMRIFMRYQDSLTNLEYVGRVPTTSCRINTSNEPCCSTHSNFVTWNRLPASLQAKGVKISSQWPAWEGGITSLLDQKKELDNILIDDFSAKMAELRASTMCEF